MPSPRANTSTHVSQDLSSVLSSRDVAGYDLNDLMMPTLDTAMSCIDDADAYGWNTNSDLTYNRDGDSRTQGSSETSPKLCRDEHKETLTGQLMKLSNRALGATQELERAIVSMPLTVNSPVVNEAFEAANALVGIINSIPPLADGSTHARDESERAVSEYYSPVFLALAAHQHVLALFRAVVDNIKRSLGSIEHGTEAHQQTLHGAGSSCAQFIMVLQLIMHLLNRMGRSLRIRNRMTTADQRELTFGSDSGQEGGGGGGLQGTAYGMVDSAQAMLRTLPDEHARLSEVIQELQACIEEGGHV